MSVSESMSAGSAKNVIAVLAIHVNRLKAASAGKNFERTNVELQNYFITPDDTVGGGQTLHRMTFQEAINRMVF